MKEEYYELIEQNYDWDKPQQGKPCWGFSVSISLIPNRLPYPRTYPRIPIAGPEMTPESTIIPNMAEHAPGRS